MSRSPSLFACMYAPVIPRLRGDALERIAEVTFALRRKRRWWWFDESDRSLRRRMVAVLR